MADLYTAVMSIPGADRALDFLQRQAAAFAYIPSRIESVRRAAEGIRARAASQNDPVTVAQAAALLSGLPKLQSEYANASGKLAEIATALRVGTGNVLALVPKVIATAGQVTLVFKSVELFERTAGDMARGAGVSREELDKLKRGGLTPQRAVGTAAKWVVILGGGWLLWRFVSGRR